MKVIKKTFNVFFALFLVSINVEAQSTFFVSPKGNDTNQGTQIRPFVSIRKAVNVARETQGKVVIYLKGGTYYLKRPVVLTSEDSRKKNESLAIRNFKNQQVTVSGSVVLNLKWTVYKNGIWQAKVGKKLIFDELFVNGQLQHMARYPNYNPTARFLDGTAADAISKERVARWKSPEGGYVHALHPCEWGDVDYLIMGKDKKGDLILM
jgi:hypothetical protein